MAAIFCQPLHRCLLLILLWMLCGSWRVLAIPPADVVNPKKAANEWVSDMAGVLDSPTEQRLNTVITWLEQNTLAEIAVVTVRSTEGSPPKAFATELFNRWSIGKAGQDNGVLILLVMESRRLEVETGYGVEGLLPDGKVGAILDGQVIPRFRQGDIEGGLLAGVETMAEVIAGEKPPLIPPSHTTGSPVADTSPRDSFRWTPLLLFALALLVIALLVARSRIRYCPHCRKRMRRLTEDQEDAYLSAEQRFEEQLGSLDYRVWRCDDCQACRVEPRRGRASRVYEDCPECGHRTLYVKSAMLREPTYEHPGLVEITRICRFPNCGHHHTEQRRMARRVRPSTPGRGSHRNWSSGSRSPGGGSFGGGSFGGGSSGGGGAGRSW